MKKIVICIICTIMCLCSLSLPGYAEENQDIDYRQLSDAEKNLLDQYMHDNPEFELDTIPLSITSETYYFDEDGELISGKARGTISSSSMTITIYTGKFYDATYDKIKVSATATWNSAPVFRLKDAFAVAWGDNFAATYYSCSTYYQGVGWKTGQSSLVSASPNAGIGYSVNVNLAQTLKKVTIQVDLQKVDSTGTANVVASYAHSTLNIGGISIGFSSGEKVSISFSGSFCGKYDTMAKMTYFNY